MGRRSPRQFKTALGCKSSILAIHDRSGPVGNRPFFQSCHAEPECQEMSPRRVSMGEGPLDLSEIGLFFKTALPSPNVKKCDQDRSAWIRVPLAA